MHESLPESYILMAALSVLGLFLGLQYRMPQRQKSHIIAFLLDLGYRV